MNPPNVTRQMIRWQSAEGGATEGTSSLDLSENPPKVRHAVQQAYVGKIIDRKILRHKEGFLIDDN